MCNERLTVYPWKIPSGFIYTMNVTEKQADEYRVKMNLKAYQNSIKGILGLTPELLFSYDTYQFTDYEKYESSKYSEEKKAKHREKQFPIDWKAGIHTPPNLRFALAAEHYNPKITF
jgi:hypothetical protein